jgi:membrane protease YdiL (CAAX protease family)
MKSTKESLKQIFIIPAVAFLAISIIPGLASVVTNLIWPMVSSFDPERVFLWITIQHIIQLVLIVLVMKFVFRMDLRGSGFNLNNWQETLRIFGWFALVYTFGWTILLQIPDIISGTSPSLSYPLTAKNMSGVLGFQFLLSGTAEEPLFRAVVMILLGKYYKGILRIWKIEIPTTGLIATIIFMLAHIGITLDPFTVHYGFLQQCAALGLGLYYAIVYHKTGSLLGPMISHGYSNTILFVVIYGMIFMFS